MIHDKQLARVKKQKSKEKQLSRGIRQGRARTRYLLRIAGGFSVFGGRSGARIYRGIIAPK